MLTVQGRFTRKKRYLARLRTSVELNIIRLQLEGILRVESKRLLFNAST